MTGSHKYHIGLLALVACVFSRIIWSAELNHEPEYVLVIHNPYLAIDSNCMGILIAPLWVMLPDECLVTARASVTLSGSQTIKVIASTTVQTSNPDYWIGLLKLESQPSGKKPVQLANATFLDTTIPEVDWSSVFMTRNHENNSLSFHQRKVKPSHQTAQDLFIVTPSTLQDYPRQPRVSGAALFDEKGCLQGLTFYERGMFTSYIREYTFVSTGFYSRRIHQELSFQELEQ